MLLVAHGNTNKLGNKNASEYTTNDKFAVLTGTVNLTNGTGSTNLDYPEGFTQNNCVPISAGYVYTSNGWWGFGVVQSAIGTGVRMTSSKVIFNVSLVNGVSSSTNETRDFKIVLMKIS